jgi:hypothetical protein
MSAAVRQHRKGGLAVVVRIRRRDGTSVRLRVKSPYTGRADSVRWARAQEAALKHSRSLRPGVYRVQATANA